MIRSNYPSGESRTREEVYAFLTDCAGYLERKCGRDNITEALKMDPQEFQRRWQKLNENSQENLIRLTKGGADQFLARFEKSDRYANAVSAAHDTTSPGENENLRDKYLELRAASGDDLLILDEM